MTAPVFVDTNVLLYAVDTADAEKHRAASEWRLERLHAASVISAGRWHGLKDLGHA